MIRKLLLPIALLCVSSIANAQNKIEPYQAKWYCNPPSWGISIPISKFFKGDLPSDYLFVYDDHHYYWNIISTSVFFSKHWGMEIGFQLGYSKKMPKQSDKFLDWMRSEYNDNYYVTPITGKKLDDYKVFRNIGRGSLGVIYRMEFGRFLVYPKFSIGYTSFGREWGHVKLKDKITDTYYNISYGSFHRGRDFYFMLAPSVTLGYKLSRRIYFNIDIATPYFNANNKIEVVTQNMNTGERSKNLIHYKRDVLSLNLGAGLIVVLKNKDKGPCRWKSDFYKEKRIY